MKYIVLLFLLTILVVGLHYLGFEDSSVVVGIFIGYLAGIFA